MKKEKKSYSKCDWILEDVAQRCYGVSILEDGQSPGGHGSEQPAVAEPAFSKVLGEMISRDVELKTRFKWHWIEVFNTNKKGKGMIEGSLTLENNLFCSHMV